MKLVTVLSLIGNTAATGRQCDPRSRHGNGHLVYGLADSEKQKVTATFKHARIEQAGPCCGNKVPVALRVPWLYWRWSDCKNHHAYSCGYSGHRMSGNGERRECEKLFILIDL